MKLFILFLIVAGFLQTTSIPLNLVLIMIICRSLVVNEKSNYYLGFLGGIVLGVLIPINLGFYSVLFLIYTKFISLLKVYPLSSNFLLLLPISFFLFFLTASLEKIFNFQSININKVLLETFLTLPAYLFIRFWEERFIVKPQIKLKIKS